MRTFSVPLLLWLISTFAACGKAEPSGKDADKNSANATPAWAAGREWRVAETPRVLIGQTSGPGAYEFDGVVNALRLPDGRVVVGDRGSGEIRYYSAAGEHVHTIGGKGGGPGEFRLIDWIGLRGDSVLVWDSYFARLSVFDTDGRLAREVRAAEVGTFPRAVGLMDGGATLLLKGGVPRSSDSALPAEGESSDSIAYLRMHVHDGRLAGKVGPFLLGEKFRATRGMASLDDYVVFGRRGVIATSGQGFYTGETDGFRLTVRGPDGTPQRTFNRAYEPVRASSADVAAEVARLRANNAGMLRFDPDMRPVQEELLSRIPHRATLPAILRVLVDGEENVWMEEFRIDREAAPAWSVFDPQGRWLGRVTTPAGLDVRQIGGGWITGVTRDANGIERVAVYELRR